MADRSVVYWYSDLERHLCGYCKNEKGNISHGMWAKCLTVEDYQNLIDRGWRRSGHYCYKPLMDQICCPMYTIKCDVVNFQLSKSQKKVIKRFNKFLNDGILDKSQKSQQVNSNGVSEFVYREAPKNLENLSECTELVENVKSVIKSGGNNEQSSSQFDKVVDTNTSPLSDSKQSEWGGPSSKTSTSQPKSGLGADPNKPPCKKAKLLRMEHKQEKWLKRGMNLEKTSPKKEQKSLEEFLNETVDDRKHKFRLQLINTNRHSEEWEQLKKVEFDLYKKYQMAIHNDAPEKCTMEGFLRFLVNSPLQHVKFSRDSDLGFGSFHQLYWLNDDLIAVGVIDILPKCVSAVYFFYDPDYRDLTLGTYGSLREVEFARSLKQHVPSVTNYYMGFYIHSCPKMRYKGKLTPSFLLCPETYYWVPIEKCIEKLEATKYAKLEESETAVDESACSEKDVDEMKLLYRRKIILCNQFKRKYGGQNLFNTIGHLIGQKCAKSLIFISDGI